MPQALKRKVAIRANGNKHFFFMTSFRHGSAAGKAVSPVLDVLSYEQSFTIIARSAL